MRRQRAEKIIAADDRRRIEQNMPLPIEVSVWISGESDPARATIVLNADGTWKWKT